METPSSLTPETPQVALPKTTAHHSRHIVYGVLLGAIAVMMVFASTIIFNSFNNTNSGIYITQTCSNGSFQYDKQFDWNNDNKIDAQDTEYATKVIQGIILPDTLSGKTIDLNCNGQFTTLDLVLFTKMISCDGSFTYTACTQSCKQYDPRFDYNNEHLMNNEDMDMLISNNDIHKIKDLNSDGKIDALDVALYKEIFIDCTKNYPLPVCNVYHKELDYNDDNVLDDKDTQHMTDIILVRNGAIRKIGKDYDLTCDGKLIASDVRSVREIHLCLKQYNPCYVREISNRGSCNKECGGGTQTRTVSCINRVDNTLVDEKLCLQQKPDITQSCNSNTCQCFGDFPQGALECPNVIPTDNTTPWEYDAVCEGRVACTYTCDSTKGYYYDEGIEGCKFKNDSQSFFYECTNRNWNKINVSCDISDTNNFAPTKGYNAGDRVCVNNNTPLPNSANEYCMPICSQASFDTTYSTPCNNHLGLIRNTNATLVETCNTMNKCEYTCIGDSKLVNGKCEPQHNSPTYQCTLSDPANALLCPGSDIGLTANTPKQLVSQCGSSKCQYTCTPGYSLINGICQQIPLPAYQCIGIIPINANLCPSDDQGLTQDTTRRLIPSCTSVQKCEYTCSTGYEFKNDICQRINNPITYVCAGATPANTTICPGDDGGLTVDTPKSLVSICSDTKKCEYTCSTEYEFKNDICQLINNPITYVCAGATPANTTICPGDDGGLTVDTPKSLVSICSDTKKCEYTCSTEYRFDVATMACIRQNYSGTPPPVGGPVPPQQPNPPSRPTPSDGSAPNRRIVDNIKRMIQILSDNCDYADKDYYQVLQKYKDVRGKQDPHDPAVILTTYCITNGYRRMLQQQFNSDAFASVYEAIKILSKIHAIGSGTKFDEKTPARPQVSYRDVARGRYTDYVNYAYDAGILDGVVRGSDLKGFTPLQTTQLETMLINAGKDTTPYSAFFRKATIRRDTMAEIFVDIYAEKFVYIEYMMGENIRFYELLLKQLQGLSATQQETYIKNLIQRMKSRDRGQLETKLNIYVDGVIKFLEQEVLMK